jgi:hypothetical protein
MKLKRRKPPEGGYLATIRREFQHMLQGWQQFTHEQAQEIFLLGLRLLDHAERRAKH